MSDEIPEPDRTVTVEEAHLLRAQVEHSKEQASEGDDLDETYHRNRVEFCEEHIDQLESGGISESEVGRGIDLVTGLVEETEPNTDERLEYEARLDTLRQIDQRYFDNGPDVVEVEAVGVAGYENGAVEFKDASGKAIVTFPSEADARGAADAILDCNGIEDEAARVGMR